MVAQMERTESASRPEPRMVRLNEAAVMLAVSRRHLTTLIQRGEVPAVRLGRRVVIPLAWLEQISAAPAEWKAG